MDNRSISHTRWKCQYHIVFIPKHKKKVLYGKLKADVRDIISTLCRYKDVEIIDGAVCEDHIHLSVAIPPKYSISKLMGYLKGKSTLMIYDRHPEFQSKWDKAFWARGDYVSTIGSITEDVIKIYKRASRRVEKRRSTKYRFISGPVTMLEIPALLGEHVIGPYVGQFKPPLEVVVMTRVACFPDFAYSSWQR